MAPDRVLAGNLAAWRCDVLGPPYERHTIDLGTDDEGPVVATLVRRRADKPSRRAVLYVHGFVDYFFQTHLADFFVEHGWDFYALDLRKYGRSLLPHQTPNFCRSLTDYYPELDEAARIIRAGRRPRPAARRRPLDRRPDHLAVGALAAGPGHRRRPLPEQPVLRLQRALAACAGR